MDLRPHPPPPSSDPKPSAVDDSTFPVLDDSFLNSTSPHMSPIIKVRRPSNPDAPLAFPSADGEWRSFTFPAGDDRHPTPAPGQPHPIRNPMFAPFPPQQPVQFSPPGFWPVNGSSGSCTPTPGGIDQVADFGHGSEGAAMALDRQPQPHGRTYSYDGLNADHQAPFFAPSASAFPGSPSSSKGGWNSTASSSDAGLDGQPAPFASAPTPGPPRSPGLPNPMGSTPLLRRDGIRKKNARFEIPAERNLRTIDQLINQTNDEGEIKELKQQKRLLRNRQAALDSRQRKKQHTERLEEEKKHFTAVITELEDHIAELKIQETGWMRDKDAWASAHQQYQGCIDAMHMEKEELVRQHTLETAQLRQKNAVLLERVQHLEGSVAMSAAPSSTGFAPPTDFSDFGDLPAPWDDFAGHHGFSLETPPAAEPPKPVHVQPQPAETTAHDDDKTVASGLLLMLLLCGAWVASRGSAASSTQLLPAIPDDVRTASATLLDSIYRDTGVHLDGSSAVTKPEPSATAPNAYDFHGLSSAPMDALHRGLTSPSAQQLQEQAFALTPAQYNRITGGEDTLMSPPPTAALEPPRRLKSLSEAVASAVASAGTRPGGLADTYARSLMKDRVPTQVLQDFARMVAQSNFRIDEGRWRHHEPLD